ncbi:hypothetical protein IL306_011624 [Fusarium sp. DS 682]|nr:hypothetical protein IL306_011624 [Fusarium sp. DS 682]
MFPLSLTVNPNFLNTLSMRDISSLKTYFDEIEETNGDDECKAWLSKLFDAKVELATFVKARRGRGKATEYVGFHKGSFNFSFRFKFSDDGPNAIIRFPKTGHLVSKISDEKVETNSRPRTQLEVPNRQEGPLHKKDAGLSWVDADSEPEAPAEVEAEEADGGAKIVPEISHEVCRKLASISDGATALLEKVITPMLSPSPSVLGYPGDNAQANYYPGPNRIAQDEVAHVGTVLEEHGIEPENTRIAKSQDGDKSSFDVLVASTTTEVVEEWTGFDEQGTVIRLVGGDHSRKMSKISASLLQAKKFAATDKQAQIIDHYVQSFQTGSLQAFRESQKLWVTDKSPNVEIVIGFVEPYRDPHGVRGEWEAMICISDPVESARLKKLVDRWDVFIRQLPWAVEGINDGKGPFEKSLFEPPDFASVNSENDKPSPCHFVHESEVDRFKNCVGIIGNITTAVHELLGHGSSKLLSETSLGQFNFDKANPPTNPLTGEKVQSWYRLGQTWTGVFGSVTPSVEECRAEVMSLYLMDNKELLSMYGFDESTDITVKSEFKDYKHSNSSMLMKEPGEKLPTEVQWAILKHLLLNGEGVISIVHDAQAQSVHVKVNRDKLHTHGQSALGDLLCRIQIWRCIADFESCSEFYQGLLEINDEEEQWRRVVCPKPEPRWKFVQPNTVLVGDKVELKEYDESNEGIVQSWAERQV